MYLYTCLRDFSQLGNVWLFLPLHTTKKSEVRQNDSTQKKCVVTGTRPKTTNIDTNQRSSDAFLELRQTQNLRNTEIS